MELEQSVETVTPQREGGIIKDILQVDFFDNRYYKFTFLNDTVRWIPSVSTKLREWKDDGIDRWRGNVGNEEADRRFEQAGEEGTLVHHACFLLATGGAVLYQPPFYQTVGIKNEAVDNLVKQNELIRKQLKVLDIPFLTIEDQYRYLQVKLFDGWLKEVKPEVLYAETVVYSLAHDVAGRIDFLFRVKEGEYEIAGAKKVWLPEGIILPDVKSGSWSDKHLLQMGAYRVAVEESLGLQVAATVGIHLKAGTNTGLNTIVRPAKEADIDYESYRNVAAVWDRKNKNKNPKDFKFESVLLGQKAEGVILGATLENPVSAVEVQKEALSKIQTEEPGKESTSELLDTEYLKKKGAKKTHE